MCIRDRPCSELIGQTLAGKAANDGTDRNGMAAADTTNRDIAIVYALDGACSALVQNGIDVGTNPNIILHLTGNAGRDQIKLEEIGANWRHVEGDAITSAGNAAAGRGSLTTKLETTGSPARRFELSWIVVELPSRESSAYSVRIAALEAE